MADTATIEKPEITKREIGERVDVMGSFEPNSVKDLGEGVFEATVTTAEVDRTGEVIDTNGVTTDGWVKTGMPVLYGHDYSGLPIGKGLSLKQLKTKMTARFQLAIKEYPFAATVADMIKGGYLNAVSIGGIVKEWSEDYMTIKALDMVEFSVVPIPANASAIITSRSLEQATGKSIEQITTEFQDFAQKALSDKLKNLDNDELTRHIETIERLLAILKASSEETGHSEKTDEKVTLTIRKAAGQVSQAGQDIIKLVKPKE